MMKKMIKLNFSHWTPWKDRHSLQHLVYPGVYALAISAEDISGKEFDWIKEIIYFGMTHSGGGLRARLNQFEKLQRLMGLFLMAKKGV
jgi:hypothetical protein